MWDSVLSFARSALRRAAGMAAALALLPWPAVAWADAGSAPAVPPATQRAVAGESLRLDGSADLPLWPAVTLRADPGQRLDAAALARDPSGFARPGGVAGNLGRRDETVWLRVSLEVPAGRPVRAVLEIDYPPLNRVDVHLVRDGEVVGNRVLGNTLRDDERPLASRTHALPLELPAGEHVLLLRVQTLSSMVLPMTLRTEASFVVHESRVQLVQGLFVGIALCMLIYTLVHWVNLRDIAFAQYGAVLLGNLVFTLTYFGIGPQWLWPTWPALSSQVAPLGVLVAVSAAAPFMDSMLSVREVSLFASRLLRLLGVVALLGLAANLAGVLGYRATQTLVTVIGLAVPVVVLPIAFARARRGDRAAAIVLGGWAAYLVGALAMAGLLRGYIEPTFWTQHLYPFATTVEMMAWMAVLGVRVQEIRRRADRIQLEADAQRRLAETDALTCLPNRRGLQARLDAALRRGGSGGMTALYLLDLDGFKPINDRHGHDVGDALLVAVGQRLRAQLRSTDVVARLGGDEFVVVAGDLEGDTGARQLGQKLLDAFSTPFDAAGRSCAVGLTIGYALAPLDGDNAGDLLKRADAAMYAGKAAGRGRVVRGGRTLADHAEPDLAADPATGTPARATSTA